MGSDAPLTLEQMVGGWPSLWGPDPSSDGQRILYCYRGTIWQVGLGAEEPQPITQGGDARWAPGGDCFALLRGEPPAGMGALEDPASAESFMRRLAAENDGQFRVVR